MIAQIRSFAKAAQRLNLSPSAVSWQIRKLEDQTGSRLFERNNQMVALTAHGSSLLGYANRLLHLHDEAVAAINPESDAGRITLGITEFFVGDSLPGLMRQFRAAYPRLSVNVEIDISARLKAGRASGALDMVLRRALPGEQVETPLLDEPLHWVATRALEWNAGDPLPAGNLDLRRPFAPAVREFYLTNPVARASALMGQLAAQAAARTTPPLAAE